MKLKKFLGITSKPRKQRISSQSKELSIGLTVRSRYILKQCLGQGGFGEVWLAEDKLTGMQFALKFYHSVDESSMDEFVKEYTLFSGLSFQYLLTAQYFDKWGKRPFIVMKYCSGGTAEALAGNVSEIQIWRFIHDVSSALAYLHNLPVPIVHQDLKPSNVLIDETGTFMLSDFGISKKIESTILKFSNRALGEGCIPYMGPERFGDDPYPIKASDIWSLGASIYELVTGELPFYGRGGVMLSSDAEVPSLNEEWSAHLNTIMRRCLSKEPWDRPTASELVVIASRMLKSDNSDENMREVIIPKTRNMQPSTRGNRKTTRISSNELSSEACHHSSIQQKDHDLSIEYVDIGLSVKWASTYMGCTSETDLGPVMSIEDFKSTNHEFDLGMLPTTKQFEELVERCQLQPKKIGRTIVGYYVIGPNGKSIYFPFIPIQDRDQRVSKKVWNSIPKEIFFPLKEETTMNTPCKVKISAEGMRITTATTVPTVRIRLIKE